MNKFDQAIISRWKKLPVFLQWVLCWPVGLLLVFASQAALTILISLLLQTEIAETIDLLKPKTIWEFIYIFMSVFAFVFYSYFFIEHFLPSRNIGVAKFFVVLYGITGALAAWGTIMQYQSGELTVMQSISNALITLILLMVPVIMTKRLILNIQRGNGDKNAL